MMLMTEVLKQYFDLGSPLIRKKHPNLLANYDLLPERDFLIDLLSDPLSLSPQIFITRVNCCNSRSYDYLLFQFDFND